MGNYINDALLSTNHHKKLKEESRGLVEKWDKTGLLEGLDGDYDRSGMAIILENQARQLIDEASKTGTNSNDEQWAGVALPLVRRIFAEIAAQDFVSVQPMNLPSGLVFYLDFKYGTNVAGKTTSESVYGKTGPFSPLKNSGENASPYPEGGLYGLNNYGYTISSSTATFTTASNGGLIAGTGTSTSIDAFIDHDSEYSASNAGNLIVMRLAGTTVRADELSARAWTLGNPTVAATAVLSGSYVVPRFTNSGSAGVDVVYNTGGASGTFTKAALDGVSVSLNYLTQPTDSTRGDFEQTGGGFSANPEADLQIPEINLELKSSTIVAKTRKLKAVWTPELAQDLNAYHSIDAEAELTSMLSEYISMEIDLEIIDMLLTDAVTTEFWSAKVGYEYDPTSTTFKSDLHASSALAYQKNTWYQTLGQKIQKVSNKIHQLTLRGGANFVVCSPSVATILESIEGFGAATDGNQAQFAMGVRQVGSLSNRWNVYKNPYMTENTILVGFRGSNFLETGAVYAPYVPLIMTPLVYDPTNFTPRKGVMTRYAKKMVRPEFYGKIFVNGLETL